MAENLAKKPPKGILKPSTSFEYAEARRQSQMDLKWDEINILQTLHPPDKDYGFMKIDEPKTPYSYGAEGEENRTLDPLALAARIEKGTDTPAKVFEEPDSPEAENLTEEELQRRRVFELRRKEHYNEFEMVRRMRERMKNNPPEDEDEIDESSEDLGTEEN
ncbi:protein phosphatase inhibitor 2-like [Ornithodoros turicata]|uniref:protein phosphatase inhibitor 2-like n=1 Tax=Ornithodoros turicata TaxID=34597 RepID=UPI0031397677